MDTPQKTPLPGWISIPIEKFSHSSSHPSTINYQWIHESKRDDLFLIFRSIRVQASGPESAKECFMMSISSGGNILEQQDVGQLVDMTQKFETMLQAMALNTGKIEAPVQIVIKRPCIAMRYTKDPTKVQRIQVRLRHDQDYDKTVEILKNLGLPMKDAPQTATTAPVAAAPAIKPAGLNVHPQSQFVAQKPTMSTTAPMPNLYAAQVRGPSSEHSAVGLSNDAFDRPRSASSETLRPSSVVSQAWSRPDHIVRPFSATPSVSTSAISAFSSTPTEESLKTANEPSLYVKQMLKGSSHTGYPAMLDGELSQGQKPQLYDFQVPSQNSSHASASLNKEQYSTPPLPMPSTHISTTQGYLQRQSIHEENFGSPRVNNNGIAPKSASSIYVAQMQGQDQFQRTDGSSPVPLSLEAITAGSNATQVDLSKLGRTTSSIHPSSSGDALFNSHIMRNNSLPLHSSQAQSLPRPQSVPIPHLHADDWIPPRRELPFLKDRAISKPSRKSVVEPSDLPGPIAAPAVQEPAPPSTIKPPPKVTKRVAQRNTKKKLAVQDNHELDSPSASGQANAMSTIPEEESTPASETSATLSKVVPMKRPSSAMNSQPLQVKRPKMIDQSTQTQTLSGRDHTTSVRALQDSAGNNARRDSTPPSNVLDQIDEFVETHKSRPAPVVDPWQTPRYADAPEEERRAMVNDWICNNLENEDFRKLCEDVDNSWRRIGLGF